MGEIRKLATVEKVRVRGTWFANTRDDNTVPTQQSIRWTLVDLPTRILLTRSTNYSTEQFIRWTLVTLR